jgi:hypothetical protein
MRFRPRTSPYALAEAGSDAEAAVSGKRADCVLLNLKFALKQPSIFDGRSI